MKIERLFGFDKSKNIFERFDKEMEKLDKALESFAFSETTNGFELDQNDNEVSLTVDLPGSNPSNTTIEFDGSNLAVLTKGKRSKFKMPDNIDSSSITASIKDGVLNVKAKIKTKTNVIKISIS